MHRIPDHFLKRTVVSVKKPGKSLVAPVNPGTELLDLLSMLRTNTRQQTDLHQRPSDSFISGESGAPLVLDNVTVERPALLLSGKHSQLCPSRRTLWQTGRREAM